MRSLRLPEKPSAGWRRAAVAPDLPGGAVAVSPRDLLLRSWPGRLFLISAGLKLLVSAVRLFVELPAAVRILGSTATLGLVISVSFFAWRLGVLMQRRLLWRVRRKLILSYIFIGVVPALLIVIFFLLGGVLIFMNVSAYLFRDGYDNTANYVKLTTQAAAAEIARSGDDPATALARTQRSASRPYPALALAYAPVGAGQPASAGPWQHIPAPSSVPAWLRGDLLATIALTSATDPDQARLVIRAAAPVVTGGTTKGYVIGDLPIDLETIQKLSDATNVRAGTVTLMADEAGLSASSEKAAVAQSDSTFSTILRKSVIFLDYIDWRTGATSRASVSLSYRPNELYRRLSSAQQISVGNSNLTIGELAIVILFLIAGLFLIIEFVALVMGLALARSITSSIHQIFMGTERVRHGDFTHRIQIETKDQLGELAQSFNQMTGSIEGLLQTAAEKKRLEEELRIAREIQMSLLPRGTLDVPGLAITALCVPAREVGGDYYDFFPLSGGRLGVLIADVSGKGTSAALYMAELKGVVLALSQTYDSPRELLITVNRIISDNLDSRSFITITYAVIDVLNKTMTYCRAGHTPLIYLGGAGSASPTAQILIPNGMVLGLDIDGAAAKFAELLEEERIDLHTGDIIVLFTDGITESMNADNDLFGETRLSQIVEEHGHLDSSELRERILREIEAFVGTADQHDDMTMILIKVTQIVAEEVAV